MKIFTHCPICNDPLLNTVEGIYIDKICSNKLNHKFGMSISNRNLPNKDNILNISLEISFNLVLVWYPKTERLQLLECSFSKRFQKNSANLYLPFFEPDFSDYPKLVSKIKSCILLS